MNDYLDEFARRHEILVRADTANPFTFWGVEYGASHSVHPTGFVVGLGYGGYYINAADVDRMERGNFVGFLTPVSHSPVTVSDSTTPPDSVRTSDPIAPDTSPTLSNALLLSNPSPVPVSVATIEHTRPSSAPFLGVFQFVLDTGDLIDFPLTVKKMVNLLIYTFLLNGGTSFYVQEYDTESIDRYFTHIRSLESHLDVPPPRSELREPTEGTWLAYRFLRQHLRRNYDVAQTLEWGLALLGRMFEDLLERIQGYGEGEVRPEQLTWFFWLHRSLEAWWRRTQTGWDGRDNQANKEVYDECPDLHDASDGVGELTQDEEEGQHHNESQGAVGEDFTDTEEGGIAVPEADSVLSPSDEEQVSDEIGRSKWNQDWNNNEHDFTTETPQHEIYRECAGDEGECGVKEMNGKFMYLQTICGSRSKPKTTNEGRKTSLQRSS